MAGLERFPEDGQAAAVEALGRPFKVVAEYLGGVANNIKLEAKMAAFDYLHGTNFRVIRHELIEQKRRERFAQSIGLVMVKK